MIVCTSEEKSQMSLKDACKENQFFDSYSY
jgi:hypothetical protein